jgi:hypothetical protein
VGVGFGPIPNEQVAGASRKLSTGYPQTQTYPQVIHKHGPKLSTGYTPDIHSLSTGEIRCVKATQKKDLVDNRVNSSEISVEQSSCVSYSIVEITV